MKSRIFILIGILFLYFSGHAQHNMTPYEFQAKYHMIDSSELFAPMVASKAFTATPPPTGVVRPIAEWEPAQAVLVAYNGSFTIPYPLIAEMSENCKVITIVTSASQQTTVTNYYSNNSVNLSNCQFVIAPLNSNWTRDYGPWFIMTNNNTVAIVDFPYNRPTRVNDDNIPVVLSGAAYLNMPLYGMNVLHTGGNYMCDGYKAAAMTDLVEDENSSLSHAQIDTLFKQYMGVVNNYITTDPLDDYIKHIDCWGKFLDVDKILIAKVPTSDSRYNDYEAMATYWANKVSSYGNNYQVYRVYEPGSGNSQQPYTNSLILNKKVFVPVYSTYGATNNNNALAVYQQAMPGYEIIPVSYSGWQPTDALHCRTHEIADKGMLYVQHQPLLGAKPQQSSYTINANVYALSGSPLITDSMFVRYRINQGAWVQTPMIQGANNLWTKNIPLSTPAAGDTIRYYIHASDASPRSVTHPLIGAPDPHKFWVSPATSVSETKTDKLLIFPNPAVDYLYMQPASNENQMMTIEVFSTMGALVYKDNVFYNGSSLIKVPVSSLPNGSYLVKVASGHINYTGKIMVMH